VKFRVALAGLLSVACLAALPAAASASFHFMKIREVYPGSIANPDSEYVELQMWAPGQNLVGGHTLSAYSANGALETYTFAGSVSHSASQSTILIASPEAEAQFGVTADLTIDKNALEPAGGAVCWETFDCVEWGDFSGAVLAGPTGDAAPAIPDGKALRRSIAPGCATLLEPGDDTNQSAADFALTAPSPRPNSVTPTEHACAPPAVAPQTTIVSGPKKKTKSKTATFEFESNKAGSTFKCSLDDGKFKSCSSPETYKKLKPGKHHFEVRATAAGKTDASPATYSWKIKKKRKK